MGCRRTKEGEGDQSLSMRKTGMVKLKTLGHTAACPRAMYPPELGHYAVVRRQAKSTYVLAFPSSIESSLEWCFGLPASTRWVQYKWCSACVWLGEVGLLPFLERLAVVRQDARLSTYDTELLAMMDHWKRARAA